MIKDKVNEFLELRDLEREEGKKMRSHHPSGVSSCMRQLWYKWKQAPVTDPRSAQDVWRMEIGNAIHDYYARILKEMGYEVQSEYEVWMEDDRLKYPIHGYIDNLLVVEGKAIPIEIKTLWGMGAKMVQAEGPRGSDIGQIGVYAFMQEYEHFLLEYLARDSMWTDEYTLKFTKEKRAELKESAIKKFVALESYVEQDIEPPREYGAVVWDGEIKKTKQIDGIKYSSDWQCMYCVRRSHCYRKEIENMTNILPGG